MSTHAHQARGGAPAGGEPRATDPVCGMSVDPAHAAGSHAFAGKTYWFCSPGCLQAFQADPGKYVGAAREREPQTGGGIVMQTDVALQPVRTGLALAVTGSIVYVVCAAAFATWPEATLNFFNAWVHGVDLGVLKPGSKPFGWGTFVYGLVGLAIAAFLTGVVYAVVYNQLAPRSQGALAPRA
jgi:YHS domain-containing protein